MVKRATFLHMFLAASLLVIIFAYGLAAAKDKLMLKYLPVDYDIEMVSQENNTTANPAALIVYQTNSSKAVDIVKGHIRCLSCREYDQYGGSQCPDCCLYGNNLTLIHCQNATDPDCRDPRPWPFESSCVNCTNTFKRTSSKCPSQCAKYPENITHCLWKGCPGTTMPVDSRCKEFPPKSGTWYCRYDQLTPGDPCPSVNARIETRKFDHAAAYGAATVVPFAECTAANVTFASTFPCYKYNATIEFRNYLTNCTKAADAWENDYYEYNNATLGEKICKAGACTSGFSQNCNVTKCQDKIKFCQGNYTVAACEKKERDYRELLLGTVTDAFDEIDPNFRYKFVARSGERYMISWQVLCDVALGDQKYNLYTMVKVWDQQNKVAPVYQSIIHQKALGSTFYINAQTGMDDKKVPGLTPGNAYIIKLYYFLPNDGVTPLKVEMKRMQMILYRAKN